MRVTNEFVVYEKWTKGEKVMSDGMTEMAYEREQERWNKLTKKQQNDMLQREYGRLEAERVKEASDGSTASYYELPNGSRELQDLISYKNMNAQIGEIFRECYRYGQASHSDELRGIKKILFYAQAELKRIENK